MYSFELYLFSIYHYILKYGLIFYVLINSKNQNIKGDVWEINYTKMLLNLG